MNALGSLASLLLLLFVGCLPVFSHAATSVRTTPTPSSDNASDEPPFEIWALDQIETRLDGGGTLYVIEGKGTIDGSNQTKASTYDLGCAVRDVCLAKTGTSPRLPHALVFNTGEDRSQSPTHAVIAFSGSGHVAFYKIGDRRAKTPNKVVDCIDIGEQAHLIWPSPDQTYLLVGSQDNKTLHRIRTDYTNGLFEYEKDAALDLSACRTPSGSPCEDPSLRPDTTPVSLKTDEAGRFAFVPLWGGGMLVIDPLSTPMGIVAEYDRKTMGSHAGEITASNGKVYGNGGLSLPDNRQGYGVWTIPVSDLHATSLPPNTPAPRFIYQREEEGALATRGAVLSSRYNYIWSWDWARKRVLVTDTQADTVTLVPEHRMNAGLAYGPTFSDTSPSGRYLFLTITKADLNHDDAGKSKVSSVILIYGITPEKTSEFSANIEFGGMMIPDNPYGIRVRVLPP